MSYKTNSPVKQVWLPLDYAWLNEVIGGTNTFGNFSKAYKEQYGIDLHDLLDLNIDGNNFSLNRKVDLLGTYNVGKLDNIIKTKYANTDGTAGITFNSQGEYPKTLMTIFCGDFVNFCHGFSIYLPVTGTPVNSIDDLEITLYEV